MRQTQQGLQHGHQGVTGGALLGLRALAQYRLGQLQIPVAELVPDKFVQHASRDVEAVGVQRGAEVADGDLQLGLDPAIRQAELHFAAIAL